MKREPYACIKAKRKLHAEWVKKISMLNGYICLTARSMSCIIVILCGPLNFFYTVSLHIAITAIRRKTDFENPRTSALRRLIRSNAL